jgi:hypothetical protein
LELVQLAKQGDGKAIATLLGRVFEQQGISVKVNLKGRCLHVLLEANPVPEPVSAMTLMRQVMLRLQPETLERLEVYGREVGAKSFSWQQEVKLQQPQTPEPNGSVLAQTTSQITPQQRELAKQGDPEAIATLLNAALVEQDMTVQVSWQNYCLHVLLQAKTVPDQGTTLATIHRELILLDSFLIQKVVVQGQAWGSEISAWQEEFELGAEELDKTSPRPQQPSPVRKETRERAAHSSTRRQNLANLPSKPRSQAVTNEGWGAVLTGLVLALVLFILSPLKLLFRGFLVMVHEVGHAVTHWLFGRPAIPLIDFAFGGGITLSFEQSWLILGLIYGAIAYLIWLCRVYPRLQGILVLFTGLYSFCLFTNWNLILSTFMGHGMEILAIFICLYLSISGYWCRMGGDRAIYAMLGFFTLFSDLQFSWQLLYDLDFQSWYDEGKGGMIDNDLVILANDYFSTNLSTVVGFLIIGCIAAPILAFLVFRYESWVRASVGKLLETN